jgi:hypothetical protein
MKKEGKERWFRWSEHEDGMPEAQKARSIWAETDHLKNETMRKAVF